MQKKGYTVLSVGGSIIIPRLGFDIPYLKKFRGLVLSEVKKGRRFILIVGGGATCRTYQTAASATARLTNSELDWLGIESTVLNAQFVRLILGDKAHTEIIQDPAKRIASRKPVIVGAGWKPGCSTDRSAVLFAKAYGAREVINLSNTDYVYDKDPAVYPDALAMERMDWSSFRRDICGSKWSPGANIPFDPVASRIAQKLGLRVSMVNGANLAEVRKAIAGLPFRGTVIG